jgi:hypothetical protein
MLSAPMRSRSFLTAALIGVGLSALASAVAGAHGVDEPTLVVPLDFVMPGEMVPVIGADLGSDADLTITLVQGVRTAELGTITAGPDGHFSTSMQVPADYPNGYSQLIADGNDGSQASTWILVGPRTTTTPARPGATEWWQDPALWLISGLLAGGGIALAVTAFKSRQPEKVAARATSQRVRRKSRRG